MFSEQRMPIARSSGFLWSLTTSTAGAFSRSCFCCSSVNAGVSSIFSRIHRPTATSSALAKNGTRQPQLSNAASLSDVDMIQMIEVESARPPAKPICGHEP